MNNASLQRLGAWPLELALMEHRDRTAHSYYGDGPKPDPLFETAARWGLDVEVIKAVASELSKPGRIKRKRGENSASK